MSQHRFISLLLLVLLSAGIWNTALYGQSGQKPVGYGQDSLTCTLHLSNLSQLCNEGKYVEALPHWRWISANCPAASENSYVDAASVYDHLIPLEKDSMKREAFIDTLMMIFDQRIMYFKKSAYVLGRKGYKQYEYRPQKPEEAFTSLKLSVSGDVYNSRPSILAVYFEVTMDLFRLGKIDTFKVYEVYSQILRITDHHTLSGTKDASLYEKVKIEIQSVYNAMSPCDDLDRQFGPLYSADTSNVEQITRFIDAYEGCHCYPSRLYFYLIRQIYELNKSGKAAVIAAEHYQQAKYPNQARAYYELATRLKDTLIAYEAFIHLGDMFTREFRDYNFSAIQIEQAISLCPDKPEAYIALGDLYTLSSGECQKTELDGRALYWLATDQYMKAKSLDSSVSQLADEKIRLCTEQYPTEELLKENNLHDSDTFQVTCWVNKPTTVRVRP